MKSVVYKHLIPFQEDFTINLKEGSKVVRIDVDQGNPYMLAVHSKIPNGVVANYDVSEL